MVVGLSLAMRAAGLGLQQLQQQRGHVRCLVGRSRTRQQGVLRMASSDGAVQKVVFLGTPSVAAKSLERLVEEAKSAGTFEISAVVTQPAAMQGRGKKRALTPSAVAAVAEENGILTLTPEKAKDDEFLTMLEDMAPDLCITAAYGQFLPKRFLAIPRLGTLNVHPSLLPRWRGASPIQRTLEAGDADTGVSVVWTVLKMDAGPIAAQYSEPLEGHEKAPELLERMFEVGTEELIKLLPSVWSEDCTPSSSQVQEEEAATKADKITVEEAQVCFQANSAATIHNRVRGFAGWPGVWTEFQIGDNEPERVKLLTTSVVAPPSTSEEEGSEDRQAVALENKMLVATLSDGSRLGISQLQPPGKKAMDAKSFANGLRKEPLRWVPRRDDPPAEEEG